MGPLAISRDQSILDTYFAKASNIILFSYFYSFHVFIRIFLFYFVLYLVLFFFFGM